MTSCFYQDRSDREVKSQTRGSQMNILLRIYNKLYTMYGPQGWWPLLDLGAVTYKKGDKNYGGYHPGDYSYPKTSLQQFEICVGAILTQNTTWQNVEKAIDNLDKEGLLDLESLHKTNIKRLAKLIRPAGYFNQKAKKLKNFTTFLIEQYDCNIKKMFKEDVNELRKELINVNGIGPETADSILLYAGRKPVFVVDAYTKRVFSRIGLLEKNASYDKAQELFMNNLPEDYKLFNEYHALIVMLGKYYCKKRAECERCAINKLCKRNI